ncbi:MAG: MBL fold metallo-hydrolase [Proteobacteria bacterium]|nr:MBL fold metallo-hydrolase [Pseudomonadota bacterium]
MSIQIKSFYHQQTGTFSYLVSEPETKSCIVIDPVLDFDHASCSTDETSLNKILLSIKEQQLKLVYILETHAHADHLTGAKALKKIAGGQICIGKGITGVQATFKQKFNLDNDFQTDGSQFDRLLGDGDLLMFGETKIQVLATPGHTNDSLTYLIEETAFIGDTLFHPDIGTARCDFPGGDAAVLYHSIQKILALPENTVLYFCHDYPCSERSELVSISIAEQKKTNKHLKNNVTKEQYIAMRQARDAGLALPDLILPSVQFNIRAGQMPPPENDGISYFKFPLNVFK